MVIRFVFTFLVFFNVGFAQAQQCADLVGKLRDERNPYSDTNITFTPTKPQKISLTERLPPHMRAELESMRALAQREGVTIVISGEESITARQLREMEELFGTKVMTIGDRHRARREIKGVVLHLGDAIKLMKAVRGELNPGYTNVRAIQRAQRGGKWLDVVLLRKAMKDTPLIANTLNVGHESAYKDFLNSSRDEVVKALNSFTDSRRTHFNQSERKVVVSFIEKFLEFTEDQVGGPAFVKFIGEAQTGDSKDTITTFKTKPEEIVRSFERDLAHSRNATESRRFPNRYILEELANQDHSATYLITSLLFKPANIMVQERLNIAKFAGQNLEIRIDVLHGIPIAANSRFGYQFFPPEFLTAAYDYVVDVFSRMPTEFKHISAGVDVAFVIENGSVKIKTTDIQHKDQTSHPSVLRAMELNLLTDSGFIFAKGETIEANEWLSEIMGQPTQLLVKLEGTYKASMNIQRRYLAELSPVVKKEKKSIRDLSRVEIGSWLAHRAMEDWDGTRGGAIAIRERLAKLFAGFMRDSPDLKEILRSIDVYFSIYFTD
jgi:hypothetical protein